MNTQEIKKLIKEKSDLSNLKKLIEYELQPKDIDAIKFKEVTGLEFQFIECDRENEHYWWVFRLNDKFYKICGDYDSWNGTVMDRIDEFYEVEHVEKKIQVWEEKKG